MINLNLKNTDQRRLELFNRVSPEFDSTSLVGFPYGQHIYANTWNIPADSNSSLLILIFGTPEEGLDDLEKVLLEERPEDIGFALHELRPLTANIFEVGGYGLKPILFEDMLQLHNGKIYPIANRIFSETGEKKFHRSGGYTFIYLPYHSPNEGFDELLMEDNEGRKIVGSYELWERFGFDYFTKIRSDNIEDIRKRLKLTLNGSPDIIFNRFVFNSPGNEDRGNQKILFKNYATLLRDNGYIIMFDTVTVPEEPLFKKLYQEGENPKYTGNIVYKKMSKKIVLVNNERSIEKIVKVIREKDQEISDFCESELVTPYVIHPRCDELSLEVGMIQQKVKYSPNLRYEDYQSHLQRIIEIEEEVKQLEREFKESEDYKNAVRAYEEDDQEALRILIPQIFDGVDLLDRDMNIYHGMTPKPNSLGIEENVPFEFFISPKEYIDRIGKIMETGLKPSRRKMGYATDEKISGIFFTDHFSSTYGPAFIYINPKDVDATVFSVDNINEIIVYAKNLGAPFQLGLKSHLWGEYLDGDRSVDPRYKGYRDEIEEELEKRNLEFRIFHPKF